jgi:hypothetical protein
VSVGRGAKRVAKAGVAKVTVRLNTRARKALGKGRTLSVRLSVEQAGARGRTATVLLRRGKQS